MNGEMVRSKTTIYPASLNYTDMTRCIELCVQGILSLDSSLIQLLKILALQGLDCLQKTPAY